MPSLLHDLIALYKVPQIGTMTAKALINKFGSAQDVFEQSKEDLMTIRRITEEVATYIISKQAFEEAEKELDFIERHEIQAITIDDDRYPNRLKLNNDAPMVLYYKGTADLNHKRIVAIVGTRKPTEQGKINCENIVEQLQEYNVITISGLAYGVDITAHRKCLEVGMDAIGVLGHGLSRIYPNQHRSAAERMIEQGGLLTEYTSEKNPEREHFPMRNRIIAGMCDALIVVETAEKGGSMISANLANQYSKDVFAFPGRLNDKNAQGCNLLIKSHQASLLESAKDIGYIMGWDKQQSPKNIQKELFVDLSNEEKNIIDLLNKSEDIGMDRLIYETNFSNSQMASLLLNLEFKGLIKPLPGSRYMLV